MCDYKDSREGLRERLRWLTKGKGRKDTPLRRSALTWTVAGQEWAEPRRRLTEAAVCGPGSRLRPWRRSHASGSVKWRQHHDGEPAEHRSLWLWRSLQAVAWQTLLCRFLWRVLLWSPRGACGRAGHHVRGICGLPWRMVKLSKWSYSESILILKIDVIAILKSRWHCKTKPKRWGFMVAAA